MARIGRAVASSSISAAMRWKSYARPAVIGWGIDKPGRCRGAGHSAGPGPGPAADARCGPSPVRRAAAFVSALVWAEGDARVAKGATPAARWQARKARTGPLLLYCGVGPCRRARGLPFSAHGVAYQAVGEAARPYRTLHPDPSDKASGRPAMDSRNKARRISPNRPEAPRPGAAVHAQRLRLDRALPAHPRGRGCPADGSGGDRRRGGLLR